MRPLAFDVFHRGGRLPGSWPARSLAAGGGPPYQGPGNRAAEQCRGARRARLTFEENWRRAAAGFEKSELLRVVAVGQCRFPPELFRDLAVGGKGVPRSPRTGSTRCPQRGLEGGGGSGHPAIDATCGGDGGCHRIRGHPRDGGSCGRWTSGGHCFEAWGDHAFSKRRIDRSPVTMRRASRYHLCLAGTIW